MADPAAATVTQLRNIQARSRIALLPERRRSSLPLPGSCIMQPRRTAVVLWQLPNRRSAPSCCRAALFAPFKFGPTTMGFKKRLPLSQNVVLITAVHGTSCVTQIEIGNPSLALTMQLPMMSALASGRSKVCCAKSLIPYVVNRAHPLDA